MSIEQVEQFLATLLAEYKQTGKTPNDVIFGIVQAQMLLHIYKKLEDIDASLSSIDKELWVRGNP